MTTDYLLTTGEIFNIQKFSIHDGPGIRTTVFLKGCPLKCLWCHNPESLDINPTVAFYDFKCKACRACEIACVQKAIDIDRCIYDRNKCMKCGVCAEKCLYNAREIFGHTETVADVIAEVMKDKIFYEVSNGGITLSGGEPFFQYNFTINLLKAAKSEGLNTLVETNAFTSNSNIMKAKELIDTFYIDLKAIENNKHMNLCKASNEQILSNIKELSKANADILFRVPLIPGLNDTEDDLKLLADFVKSLKNKHSVEILAFHQIGSSKYAACGMNYELASLIPQNDLNYAKEFLTNKGIDTIYNS